MDSDVSAGLRGASELAAPGAAVRQAVVLLNTRAGTAARVGLQPPVLAELFRGAGVAAEVETLPCERLAARARQALDEGVDTVVAGGGDGTIGTVAGALAGSGVPLGVLPLGTRNHFARDLGLPLEVQGAVAVIAAGWTRAVDLGEVNGRVFVNNASVGLYPEIVERRERRERRLGWTRTLATLWATVDVLRRFRVRRVRLHAEGGSAQLRTPFVFVGNNEYQMRLFELGARRTLDVGQLSLYTAHLTRRLALLRLALLALLGRLEQARDFDLRTVSELWLESRRRRLRVAVDGELLRLRTPLHFRARPGALRVLAPPGAA